MTTQNAAVQQTRSPAAVNDDELHKLLLPNINDLPVSPPSAMESNFVTYFAPGCVLLGWLLDMWPFKDEGGITAVDFNVGKSNRSEIKVTWKRKRNAQQLRLYVKYALTMLSIL